MGRNFYTTSQFKFRVNLNQNSAIHVIEWARKALKMRSLFESRSEKLIMWPIWWLNKKWVKYKCDPACYGSSRNKEISSNAKMSVSFSQNIYFGRAFLPLANLKKVIWNRSFRSLKKWSSSLSVHFFWKKWSRSVQFSDLDHWTDLARSIQPCSAKLFFPTNILNLYLQFL